MQYTRASHLLTEPTTVSVLPEPNAAPAAPAPAATAAAAASPNDPKQWLQKTPSVIRAGALRDFIKALKSAYARHKKDKKNFELQPRSLKRSVQESIAIPHSEWTRKRGYFSFFRKMQKADRKKRKKRANRPRRLPEQVLHDFRLVRRRGTYYLCIPEPLEVQSENQAPATRRIVALDPGVRTFLTGYDPSGETVEIGKNDVTSLYRLFDRLNKLQRRCNEELDAQGKKVSHRTRSHRRRAAAKLRRRMTHLIDDLHWKTAKYLCETYHFVLLPEFAAQPMVRWKKKLDEAGNVTSKSRVIGPVTARALLTLAPYRFRQRLLHKARQYPWCTVEIVTEEMTSQTCGQCGAINKIGRSKLYRCTLCNFKCDRDTNAARNVLLRYYTTQLKKKETTTSSSSSTTTSQCVLE